MNRFKNRTQFTFLILLSTQISVCNDLKKIAAAINACDMDNFRAHLADVSSDALKTRQGEALLEEVVAMRYYYPDRPRTGGGAGGFNPMAGANNPISRSKFLEMAKELIARGAKPNSRTLYWAAQRDPRMCELVLTHGAKVGNPQQASRILQAAIDGINSVTGCERVEICKILLNAGARPDNAILRIAVDVDDADIVLLLLNNKADITARDSLGRTPLERALIQREFNAYRAFKKYGHDVCNEVIIALFHCGLPSEIILHTLMMIQSDGIIFDKQQYPKQIDQVVESMYAIVQSRTKKNGRISGRAKRIKC